MRLLITGGAGFIGHNLAKMAVSKGHDVVVVDDLSTGYEENVRGLPVTFHRMPIQELASHRAPLQGVDSVVHLAALGSVPRSIENPMASHSSNATGTLAVLEAARHMGVSHVVAASSSSVYGMNPALPKGEREWVRPMSPYAVTKLATEQYTLAYQQSFGMATLAFRFFNVFGPGQRAGHAYAAVIPAFIDAIMRGEPVQVDGDGTQSRDFTYVETVCNVLLDAATRGITHPEPVNLAFGTNISLLTLLESLRDIVGADFQVRHRAPRAGDVPHSQAANETLRQLFAEVHPVPLEEGLRRTLEWFQSL